MLWRGPQLWQEECRHEEGVIRKFQDAGLAVDVEAHDPEARLEQLCSVIRVQAEATSILFDRGVASVDVTGT